MDTTSHSCTWKIFEVGVPGASVFWDAVAISDTEIWLVGDIELANKIPTIPSGKFTKYANVAIIRSETWEYRSYQFLEKTGKYDPRQIYGITKSGDDITLWSKYYNLTINDTGIAYNSFLEIADDSAYTQYFASGKYGHSYVYGKNGYLGQFAPKKYSRPKKIETGTRLMIQDMTEVDPNEYYVSGWDAKAPEGFFHHIKDGVVTKMDREYDGKRAIFFAYGLWASYSRLYATSPPYIYIQSLREPEKWDTLRTPKHRNGNWTGRVMDIKGRSDNDVYFVGHTGSIYHYNGRTVKTYDYVQESLNGIAIFFAVELTKEKIYVVGGEPWHAVVAIGTVQR